MTGGPSARPSEEPGADGETRSEADRVLDELLDLPPGERRARMQELDCRPQARHLVEQLLARLEDGGIEPGGAFEGEFGSALSLELGSQVASDTTPCTDGMCGEVVGAYRLERPLGRGGMGDVYLGRRGGGGVEQEVAIKLIRRGLDTEDILARFERERHLLAGLDHPGIARLFDGGATEDGRPYLVMEVVHGVRLDEYCAQRALDVHSRCRLFLKVCAAVEHAHESQIVHRDLKPSNILVTAAGEPKLLDFGVARLLDETGTVRTRDLTATRQRLLTPDYASPEQVLGRRLDVRTDVYSLGVVLYELLTGERPHGPTSSLGAELEREVVEVDPVPPSRRAPRARRADLRGDLDCIVMTALRKEPERRYASARELEQDLERHLAGRPVLARPATWRYRAGKFVRRNRLLAASTLAVVTALTIGLVAAFTAYRRTEASRLQGLRREYAARVLAAESSLRARDAAEARRHLIAAPESERGWEWRHLLAQTDTSTTVLRGHGGEVAALAWSADGRKLATRAAEHRVFVWNVESGELQRTLDLPEDPGTLSITPGGDALLAELGDRGLMMLDLSTGAVLWTLDRPYRSAALSPDGSRVAGALADRVELLRATDGVEVAAHPHGGLDFHHASWSRGGVLFSTMGGETWSWLPGEGKFHRLVRDFSAQGHSVGLNAVASDDNWLVVGTTDGLVRVWNFEEDDSPRVFQAHGDRVMGIDLAPGGERFATASMDRSVKVWDVRTGALLDTLHGQELKVLVARFDPSGGRIAAAGGGGGVRIWDLPTSAAPLLQADRAWRMGLALARDGRRLATGAWDAPAGASGGVACWSVAERALLWRTTFRSPGAASSGVKCDVIWSQDGERLFVADPAGFVRVVGAETGELLDSWAVDAGVERMALSPDGTRLATGYRLLFVFDARDGALLADPVSFEGLELIQDLDFSPDGELLALSGMGQPLLLIEARSRAVLARVPRVGARAIAFSPDGTRLASSTYGTIHIRHLPTLAIQAKLVGHTLNVRDLVFSPDGARLVSASVDKTLIFWDPQTGSELVRLHGHDTAVDAVRFSPDGRRLVSQERGGAVRMWEAPAPSAAAPR